MGCGNIKSNPNPLLNSNSLINQDIQIRPGNFVQQNQQKFQNLYRITEHIGKGRNSNVHICFNKRNGTKRAVKIIKRDSLNETSRYRIEHQMRLIRQLDHPNILRVLQYFQDIHRIYILMQFCSGKQLIDQILSQSYFTQTHAARIISQLFSVINYLHSNNIVHRDIKPQNILLQTSQNQINIKLIDFKFASQLIQPQEKLKGYIGTSYYSSPEMVQGTYSKSCDMWSSGAILYMLLCGNPPFNGNSHKEVLEKVTQCQFDMLTEPWPYISSEAKDLVRALLVPAESRISAMDALQHPWIQENATQELPVERYYNRALDNLKEFNMPNKLRDAVHTFITSQCTSLADTKILREIFRKIDLDGDGKLSREELLQEYESYLGLEEAESNVEKIMEQADSDKNGYVDYIEFLKATLDKKKVLSMENLKSAFQVFDRDGSGAISANQLKKVLLKNDQRESQRIMDQIIKELDQNGDGEIDLIEFQELILNNFN